MLAYILITAAMGILGFLGKWLDPWEETPIGVVGMLAGVIFAIMFILLVVSGIIAITGVEVTLE